MKFIYLAILLGLTIYQPLLPSTFDHIETQQNLTSNTEQEPAVIKHVLPNGFTILIKQTHNFQPVATELWIQTGSKEEITGEKGIAHLIEHMLFKGTTNLLSETDVTALGNQLSAYVNAITGDDTTSVQLRFPISHWQVAIPVLADIMVNCTFNPQHLNSELQTVVQELHMYRDMHEQQLFQSMIAAIIPDHPYHYPVIGYRHDLWSIDIEQLKAFYKKHYVPANSFLVVVGNIDPQEVISLAQNTFGTIPASPYTKKKFHHNNDIKTHDVVLYRDVAKPTTMLLFTIPGKSASSYLDAISLLLLNDILIGNKASRLKKIEDELELADDLSLYPLKLNDLGFLICSFQPRDDDHEKVIKLILDELIQIATHGCTYEALHNALTVFKSSHIYAQEYNTNLASYITQGFNTKNDENAIFQPIPNDIAQYNETIKTFVRNYLRPILAHTGHIVPLDNDQKKHWEELEHAINQEEQRIVEGKTRTEAIEPEQFAKSVTIDTTAKHTYPKPDSWTLPNDITVLAYHNPDVSFIDATLFIQDKNTEDIKQSTLSMLEMLIMETGTTTKTPKEIDQFIDAIGAQFSKGLSAVSLRCMSEDITTMVDFMLEWLTAPLFESEKLALIKKRYLETRKNFWKEEHEIADALVTDLIADNGQGRTFPATETEVSAITLAELTSLYHRLIHPQGTVLVLVGNLDSQPHIKTHLNQTIGTWKVPTPALEEAQCKNIKAITPERVTYHLPRSQAMMIWAGISPSFHDSDARALHLYGANFNGRLFKLREQHGAFYTISGSTGAGGHEQGIVSISTITSPHRIKKVTDLITHFIREDIEQFSEADLRQAKESIWISQDKVYASNRAIKNTFYYLYNLNLPFDYYEKRQELYASITLNQVKAVVKKHLNLDVMKLIIVGPLGEPKMCSTNLLIPESSNESDSLLLTQDDGQKQFLLAGIKEILT